MILVILNRGREMKETGFLKIIADRQFSEKTIVINPNDGFDLGLMMTEATVEMYMGDSLDVLETPDTDPLHARLYQKNECKLGTIELSYKTAEKLNGAKQVRLHLTDDNPYPKLLLATV